MNRFRLFLHAFGIHYWTEWTEPEEMPLRHSGLFMDTTAYIGHVQKRECKICNLEQICEVSGN